MSTGPAILHLLNASDAGGLSRYVLDIAQATARAGSAVHVACDRGAWHDRFIAAGISPIELPLNRGLFGFRSSVNILRVWMEQNPVSVIHSHYRRTTLLARKANALIFPAATQLVDPSQAVRPPPILYTLHLSHIAVGGWRRWFADFGDHTHIASENARLWLIQQARVAWDKITCIPHGIAPRHWPAATDADRAAARTKLNIPHNATVMCYVGRLDDPKNVPWVIDAHKASAGSVKNLHTLIVGDGPHRNKIARQIGASSSAVHLLGEQPPLTAYHAADLLVLPSSREGFSYVCAEALATGLPILRTQTTGTHETIVENVTGKSVPIDRSTFIHTARDMLAQPVGLRAMRLACAAHAREHLSFERQLLHTQRLYEKLAWIKS